MSQLATPSGIDHDYNFLHGIETRIQRSEKVLIEDLGIVTEGELKRAREGKAEEAWKQKGKAGEVQISTVLQAHNIRVAKAPKGMRRNQENTTTWGKKAKDINWQVEWVREAPTGRTLYQAMGNMPIGDSYDRLCEEERKLNMTPEERHADKKRKADIRAKAAKRTKLDTDGVDVSMLSLTEDLETSAMDALQSLVPIDEIEETPTHKERNYNLYLLRTSTPASFPKVLTHIDPSKPLNEILRNRQVLEFPTIHVLANKPEDLPGNFMLENAFLAATGQPGIDTDMESSDSSEVSDDTSTDGDSSSEDESDAEDGEIVG